jgi:membrane protease YdiL (CAAX protease family)
MNSDHRTVLPFLILVFVLSVPFWILGSLFDFQFLPGLPIGALAVFIPGIAGSAMAYRSGRSPAVRSLLRRSFDAKRIRDRKWYLVFVLFNPIVAVFSFQILRAIGVAVPNPPPLTFAVLPLLLFSFIAALGEEIGWTGYATEPFLSRWGILPGGVLLGLFWAAFHLILLTQVDRSLEWIAWWSLGTLSLRAIMVWLYDHAGDSVFAAAIFHALINLSWQLFPINGSFYDPKVFSLVTLALGVLLALAGRLVSRAKSSAA